MFSFLKSPRIVWASGGWRFPSQKIDAPYCKHSYSDLFLYKKTFNMVNKMTVWMSSLPVCILYSSTYDCLDKCSYILQNSNFLVDIYKRAHLLHRRTSCNLQTSSSKINPPYSTRAQQILKISSVEGRRGLLSANVA